eukprot:355489-Chlamydomonas_euryale.AAC.10
MPPVLQLPPNKCIFNFVVFVPLQNCFGLCTSCTVKLPAGITLPSADLALAQNGQKDLLKTTTLLSAMLDLTNSLACKASRPSYRARICTDGAGAYWACTCNHVGCWHDHQCRQLSARPRSHCIPGQGPHGHGKATPDFVHAGFWRCGRPMHTAATRAVAATVKR